ncbi:MAG: sodium:solute symporter family protein [candidate division Zixibacteria bacterium]|nr:sodium:solute symporter family protein [candidate division Zixibacteria bacterium]
MLYFWAILIYLLILIGVGAILSRRVKTQTDFMVAGRRLSAPVLVGTLLATWIGSGSIIAGAGLSFEKGFAALWFNAGVWVAIIVLYFIAGRARKLAQFTVPDILEIRYNKYARILGSLTTIIAYTAIVSYQFKAGGMVLNMVIGIPVDQGIILTAVFVIAYTALAGMFSVAYTDVVNGVVLVVGFIIGLPFLLKLAGGWGNVTATLPVDRFQILRTMTIWEALSYSLPTMLLLLGESNMYQRFFSARDERAAKASVLGWISGTIFVETLIVVLAIIGSSIFLDINPESVILHSVRHGLSPVIGCVLLAAIVAVIVSTADSFLLVPSTNIMRDIYQRFINPNVSQKRMVLYSRLVVIGLGIIAFIQVKFFTTVLAMALYAYTMYGVGVTPATLAAFFWKRATPTGGVCSIALGMVSTIGWELLKKPFGIPTVYPALALSVSSLIIISLLTPKPKEEKVRPFFQT